MVGWSVLKAPRPLTSCRGAGDAAPPPGPTGAVPSAGAPPVPRPVVALARRDAALVEQFPGPAGPAARSSPGRTVPAVPVHLTPVAAALPPRSSPQARSHTARRPPLPTPPSAHSPAATRAPAPARTLPGGRRSGTRARPIAPGSPRLCHVGVWVVAPTPNPVPRWSD